MKKLLLVASLLFAVPAHAGEVTIKVSDQWKATLENAQVALDRCIGGMVVRSDPAVCREIHGFLQQLANLPITPVVVPPPAAPATPPPPVPQSIETPTAKQE